MAKVISSYFPHDSNARFDIKIRRLRKVLGAEGYGIYWMVIEVLREQESFEYPIKDIDLLADEFNTSLEKVTAVIKSFELFELNDDKTFYSTSLIARLEPYLKKSNNARLAANKRWENARKSKGMHANALQQHYEGNADAMQIEEKRLEEKRREKNIKDSLSKKKFSDDSIEIKFSKLLYDLIKERNPNQKKPNFQDWAKNIDLMIRIDKRSEREIEGSIRWSQKDGFWQDNILSTKKLRQKFDQLYLRAKNGKYKQIKPAITETELREFSESILADDRYK